MKPIFKLVSAAGKQNPQHFEGGAKYTSTLQQTLPLLPQEEMGLTAALKLTNEELVEIRAEE
jgi:hypothetical protein